MYSTANLPSREALKSAAGTKVPDSIALIDAAFEKTAGLVIRQAPDQAEFIARVRRSWNKWMPRVTAFGNACMTEPMLEDYASERMTGLATGLIGEGVSLAVLLLGAVAVQEPLHSKKKLWSPFLTASITVLDETREALYAIESWMDKNQRSPLDRCLDIALREDYALASRTLKSMKDFLISLEERPFFDGLEVKRVMADRSDVARCAELATKASRFLEEQGALGISMASAPTPRVEELARLSGDTVLTLHLCQTKINVHRKSLDLPPHTALADTIHDVARMFLANEIPYVASPWLEGLSAATGRRSHLEMDLTKISEVTGFTAGTLRQYVERRQALQPAAAPALVAVVKASHQTRCFYRYYVVEVEGTGVQNRDHSYRLEVTSQDEPAPRGALDAAGLERVAEGPQKVEKGPKASPKKAVKPAPKKPAPKKPAPAKKPQARTAKKAVPKAKSAAKSTAASRKKPAATAKAKKGNTKKSSKKK